MVFIQVRFVKKEIYMILYWQMKIRLNYLDYKALNIEFNLLRD